MVKRVRSKQPDTAVYQVTIPEGRFQVTDYYNHDSLILEKTEIINLETKEGVNSFLLGKIDQLVNDFYHGKKY